MTDVARNPDVVITTHAHRLARPAQIASTAPMDASAPVPAFTGIHELLRRMQAGDRDAAAEFLLRYESRIRRRIRGKLNADVRRLFDSLDIVSTLGRRLDLYVMSGQLQACNEAQCLSLLFKIADRAMIDKARIFRQMESVEGEDSQFARQFASRLRDAERRRKSGFNLEIENCITSLADPVDRRILSLWLTGEKHTAIAEALRLSPTTVRKRWETIKIALRTRFEPAVA